MTEANLKFKRIHPDAIIPEFQTEGASAFDIHAIDGGAIANDHNVETHRAHIFSTGLEVEVPAGYTLLILSRSGHGFKSDVRLSNCVGVIDSDYRGELKVKLIKDVGVPFDNFNVSPGDRIAQGIVLQLPTVRITEVEELSDTTRGKGGFGSTGTSTAQAATITERRKAYDDEYHKVAAEMSYPEWCKLWAKGWAPPQLRRAKQNNDPEANDRTWAARDPSLREGSTVRVPGVGEL